MPMTREKGIFVATSTLFSTLLTTLIISPVLLVSSYVIDPNSLADVTEKSMNSALGSKVIFESPSVENILKEFIVSTKPLTLRKYPNRPKTKKTKKDSRIYYIPIPPLPYRYIPGIGYDYQPMKIKPLLVEPSSLGDGPISTDFPNYSPPQNPYKHYHQQLQNSFYQSGGPQQQQQLHHQKPHHESTFNQIPVAVVTTKPSPTPSKPSNVAESKVYRLDRHDYYFNGRPFRLQVAHAGPKYNLTPQNLKSSFYFNKNIIY
ncbi:uncharacterized protein LOC142221819 [Haematobia irritans]|uniref:uncharacterized protein LOC142221819 n=1 Tax=Haematobia irritans TaxID=7368 RepID=UPI003F50AD85